MPKGEVDPSEPSKSSCLSGWAYRALRQAKDKKEESAHPSLGWELYSASFRCPLPLFSSLAW